jgi:cell division protein FtsW
MSITMIMVGLTLAMLFAGGAKGKHFAVLAVPVIVAVPVLIAIEPYRLQRLLAFVNPWASPKGEGYQLIQSYYALGSGGLFGVGFLHSRQKYMFLPFAESDFIFSVIGEEWGLVGAVAVVALLLYIVYLGLRIASQSRTRFAALLAYGITAVIALQSLLNVAVVTGSVPPTGVPLPFVSFGGSSLVCFMGAVGVLLSIDRINRSTPLIK